MTNFRIPKRWPPGITAVLASILFLATACGASNDTDPVATGEATTSADRPSEDEPNTTGAESDVTQPCVTVVTTIPGQVFCDGYEPDFGTSTDETPLDASECPDGAGRPDGGWLAQDSAGLTQQLNALVDPQPAPGHPDRIRLSDAAAAAVPPGFDPAGGDAMRDARCPNVPTVISASFSGDDGEEIHVWWTRLRSPIEWFNEPISGDVERTFLDDGTQVVANDFGGMGQKHRVWAARPDGSVIKVIVAGANAPSQAGWPTTTTRFDDDRPEAMPAPLTLAESVDLALSLLD